jgi:hypothetical protein
MKRIFTLILVITLILTFSTLVFGTTPVGFGAKAAAMGGAFTAVADDGSAAYWNPAGINQLGFFTLTPGAGIYGSYDSSFDYNSLNNSNTFPPPIPSGSMGIPVFAGITTKYAGVNAFADISTTAVDNSLYTQLYADGSIYGTITVATSFDNLMVGVNYKIVKGAKVVEHITKIDASNYQDYIDDPSLLGDNWQTSAEGNGYSVDIGAIYKLNDKLKLGFTGRNLLSSVTWDQTTTNYIIDPIASADQSQVVFEQGTTVKSTVTSSLPRTFAFGAAYRATKTTLLAVDVEVITADDADLNQTRYHFGFEQTALWNVVALRLGAFTDKNEKSLGLTAGLGFKAGPVLIDLAAIQAGNSSLGFFAAAGFKF